MRAPVEGLLPGYFRVFQDVNGGFVDVHESHGKLESRQNLPIALFLAARGEQIRLLPVHDLPGVKSPDATRNGVAWKFKTLKRVTANAGNTALRNASKQADRVLLTLQTDFNVGSLEPAMFDRLRRVAHLVEIAVLLGNNIHHFSRAEILRNTFRGKMGKKNGERSMLRLPGGYGLSPTPLQIHTML